MSLAVLLGLAGMVWLVLDDPGPARVDVVEQVVSSPPHPLPREQAPLHSKIVQGSMPEPQRDEAHSDAVEVHERSERQHAHPIDDTRLRIYRENNLNGAMMGAMNVGDYQGLRALIEEYRLDYPQDSYRLQEGFSIVADCMERLTADVQDRARNYWRTRRGSIVRRFIRRHCLDKPVIDADAPEREPSARRPSSEPRPSGT